LLSDITALREMKLPDGYTDGVPPRKPSAMGGFGQKLLENMGWQKGEGLGKDRQGRKAPVEVIKKDDTVGLGGKRTWNWEHNYAAQAYDTAIMNVQCHGDASETSSSDSSDDEQAAFHDVTSTMREDIKMSPTEVMEIKLARQLAKGNNLGRFGARAGKMARIMEQEALFAARMGVCNKSIAERDPESSTSDKKWAGKAAQRPVVELSISDAVPLGSPPPRPSTWWGRKVFVSGGWLGSLSSKDTQTTRTSFSHATQEAIYKSAQEGRRKVCI
jgi:hypothetical protein